MIKPPIVVIDGDDIMVHSSVEDAEIDLEPGDVKSGGIEVYDSAGQLLDLSVTLIELKRHFLYFKWTKHYEGVRIKIHEPIVNRVNELRAKLLSFLSSKGMTEKGLEDTILEELIKRVGK